MRSLFALIVLATSGLASAGDEFQTPELVPGSSYESSDPRYRLIGIEDGADTCAAWVVAESRAVFSQREVNKIIASVYGRVPHMKSERCPSMIYFYSWVGDMPQYPSFRITDNLGTYVREDNKTYFLGGAKTYGSWVHGPGHAP